LCLLSAFLTSLEAGEEWPLDVVSESRILLHGASTVVPGVAVNAIQLDGRSLVELRDTADLGSGDFSFLVWVNPFAVGGEQRMIAAKNRYGRGEREWGVMIDQDSKFRLYAWQGRWKTVAAELVPVPGRWHRIGMVKRTATVELWINGHLAGKVDLEKEISSTGASITLGGVVDPVPRQTFFGAFDEAVYESRAFTQEEMKADFSASSAILEIPEQQEMHAPSPDPFWTRQGEAEAREDRGLTLFLGNSPDKLACDTTLRVMPDGSWVHLMLGGGDKEPDPRNGIFLQRSRDEGLHWSPPVRLDFGFPREGDTAAAVPSELMVHEGKCTLFFATHDGSFGGWRTWFAVSGDSCATWSDPQPAPGRLRDRTFIRNHIVTRDGRILLPFQHYAGAPRRDPINGVLMSADGGRTWTEHGEIRLTRDPEYAGWAENNLVELIDGRLSMIIRADRLGGVLFSAESTDGGLTWPEFAAPTNIPNPGSKATLYSLGGNSVALLHNPNSRTRSPLGLWVSFDGMKTWPYQRVLRGDLEGRFNYPDGFVSEHGRWLHFAFDHNRDKALLVSARLPEIPRIWDEMVPLGRAANLPVLEDVRFSVIKPYEYREDGYRFLHGVGLAFHRGKLYASFGHNRGGENTDTEEARFCVSEDGGMTWSGVKTIDSGEGPVGVSHGAFLSQGDRLWAFMGAYTGTMEDIHTRAYRLEKETESWESLGSVIGDGFWPMQEPVRMDDGNWIMAGIAAGAYDEKGTHPAAVAISRGDDFLKWDLVKIPPLAGLPMWGESTVIVEGNRITCLSRFGLEARALVAESGDFGRTWTTMRPSNLPLATSKPIAGRLSNGQRYLIGSTSADGGKRRAPLTIAVTRPGENVFSRVFVIRHAEFPAGPGESHARASLSYPYAIEHEGMLYVGYSNNGGNVGRVGEGRELWNNNSAELAVIPLESLRID
ncbi:MAG: exo-alpha-sialidase, partial [Verrucomicrobiae bacterium]|nr:exo-alpha-sialidase [Verrucomicrobiae bacterium]